MITAQQQLILAPPQPIAIEDPVVATLVDPGCDDAPIIAEPEPLAARMSCHHIDDTFKSIRLHSNQFLFQ